MHRRASSCRGPRSSVAQGCQLAFFTAKYAQICQQNLCLAVNIHSLEVEIASLYACNISYKRLFWITWRQFGRETLFRNKTRPKWSSLTAKNFERLGNMNFLKDRWERENSDEED
jgi:hypothetical protein